MKRSAGLFVLFATVALSGCGGDAAGREAVAELTTKSDEVDLLPAGFTDVEIELRPLRALDEGAETILFVHLVDDERRIVRTFDRPLDGEWPVGGSVRVSIRMHLSAIVEPQPPAGDYFLQVGLYDPLLGRYSLRTDRPRVGKKEYRIGRVRIAAAPESDARLEFDAGWGAEERVTDLQVVSQRPLRPDLDATVHLQPLTGPVELLLLVGLPATGLADELMIRDGSEHARLRVSSPCAPAPAEVVGPGTHTIVLALAPDATGRCALRFEANHVVRSGPDRRLATPTLQAVAWRSARR